MDTLKILHLEDSENDAELVRTAMEEYFHSFYYRRVETRKDYIQKLNSEKFDFILSDYSLPGYDGMQALGEAVRLQPRTPFIFISGTLVEELAIQSLKDGATDYILKNNLKRLVPTMIRALDDISDKEKRREAENRYKTLVEAAREVIFTLTTDGIITSLNPAFEIITGWHTREWIGKKFDKLVHSSDQESLMEKIIDTLTGKLLNSFEVRILLKNGDYMTGEFLTTPLAELGDIKEIMGLVRDVSERKKNEDNVRNSLAEKESLLKEIHHRVKNNLQIISSMLSLVKYETHDSNTASVIDDLSSRVMTMSMVHKNLYQSGLLTNLNFENYLRQLIEQIKRIYNAEDKDFSCKINCRDLIFDLDSAIPLGLVINEIVSNSLKKSLANKTRLEMSVHIEKTSGKQIMLKIEDFCANHHASREAYMNDNNLGKKIVETLVSQLEGTMELKFDGGTEYIITFKQG